MKVPAGANDVTTYFALRDTADGTAKTALTITTLDLQSVRSGLAPVAKVDATALAATDSAHADNKAIEVDATDQPGLYRVDWSDALFAAGVREVTLTVKAAGVFTEHLRVTIEHSYDGPRGRGVYLDDGAANTNTVAGVDGSRQHPVSTIAAIKTIADGMGIKRVYLINNTVVPAFAAPMPDWEFVGIGEMTANTIGLGSQDVDNSEFHNVLISGAQGGTGRFQARSCVLSGITSMEVSALGCTLADGSALVLRNDCMFVGCHSAIAGTGTPTLDINSVANVNVYFRNYQGGVQIDNAVSTTVMSFDCPAGQLIIGATCTSIVIVPRGILSFTDNGTTTVLTGDAIVNRTTINAEADTAAADYGAALASVCTETRLAELDAANLPTDIAAIPTTAMRGTDSAATEAKQDTIDTVVDAIKAVTDALPDSGALTNIGTDTARLTDVRAAVLTDWINGGRLDLLLDAIKVATDLLNSADTEPAAVPAANATPVAKLGWLFAFSRNKGLQTDTTKTLRDDADGADIAASAVSDDGTTFTRGKWS